MGGGAGGGVLVKSVDSGVVIESDNLDNMFSNLGVVGGGSGINHILNFMINPLNLFVNIIAACMKCMKLPGKRVTES